MIDTLTTINHAVTTVSQTTKNALNYITPIGPQPKKLPVKKVIGEPSKFRAQPFLKKHFGAKQFWALSLPLPIPDVLCFLVNNRYYFYIAHFDVVLPNEMTPKLTYKPYFGVLPPLNKIHTTAPAYFNKQFEKIYDYIACTFLEQFFDVEKWRVIKVGDTPFEKLFVNGKPHRSKIQATLFCYHPVENEFTYFTQFEWENRKVKPLNFNFDSSRVVTFKTPERFPYIPYSHFVCGSSPLNGPIIDWAIHNNHPKLVDAVTFEKGM